MPIKEKTILLGQNKTQIGILSLPENVHNTALGLCIIFLNAGFTHRIGPNRVYVKLARSLASGGIPCLRFDFSGIGDSMRRSDDVPFDEYGIRETLEAMSQMQSGIGAGHFVLVGICSGADIGFQVAQRDKRVVGLICINGILFSDPQFKHLLDQAKHLTQQRYYSKHKFNLSSWYRFLTGKSSYRNLIVLLTERIKVFRKQRLPHNTVVQEACMAQLRLLINHSTQCLLIYSEGSQSYDFYRLTLHPLISQLDVPSLFTIEIVDNADHILTPVWSQELLCDTVGNWITTQVEMNSKCMT